MSVLEVALLMADLEVALWFVGWARAENKYIISFIS